MTDRLRAYLDAGTMLKRYARTSSSPRSLLVLMVPQALLTLDFI